MKKKMAALIVCALMILSIFPITAFGANNEDIVILYENDVHCIIEGYSKLAAMKNELQEEYEYVGVVSGGDFIQGNSLGVISQGKYIVDIMNHLEYDLAVLGIGGDCCHR